MFLNTLATAQTTQKVIESSQQTLQNLTSAQLAQYQKISTSRFVTAANLIELRSAACTVAEFRNTDNPFVVRIEGSHIGCPCETTYFFADISGGIPGNYQIEWFISPDGVNYGGVLDTTDTFQIEYPCPSEGTFYLRLKVTAPNGQGKFRVVTVHSSNTPPSGEVCGHGGGSKSGRGELIGDNLSAFPNPTTGMLNVSFTKTRPGFTTVQLHSIEGRTAKTLHRSELGQGAQSFGFILGDLPQGFYLLKVVEQDKVQTKTVFLIR